MFQFIFRFHIIFRFHAYSIWNFRYLYEMMPTHTSFMYSCPSMNLFFLGIGINSIGSSTQVMAFSCQLVGLPILPRDSLQYSFFQCLVSIFDTGSLFSFKAKVLRVHLQLESPKSEHRNSSYVQNNSDYSMIKTDAGIGLHMAPL